MGITYADGIVFNATNQGETQFVDNGYASTAFIILSGALVMIMAPGLGFFYSGMARAKNALSLIMICFLAMSVISLQWTLFGFSLAFSESGSAFIGNFAHAGLTNIGAQALPKTVAGLSSVAFVFYQMQFATLTPAIIFGSVAERIRLIPAMIFIFLWGTFVYDFAAYWTWSYRGWLRNISCLSAEEPCLIGGFDFAGGGPVHIASGFAGLAYCIFVGKRRRTAAEEFRPHNMSYVFLGTGLLWFGWIGFNGGSALTATPRAAMSSLVTFIAAGCGGLGWSLYEYIHTKKLSGLAYCSGVVAGLVAITPAAGFVAPWAAIAIGFSGGIVCCMGTRVKLLFGFDDSLDGWGVHGVGGMWGAIVTGFFSQKWIGLLDGTAINGGWVEGNFVQMGYQVAGAVAIAVWSFVISYALLFLINLVPGLSIRSSEEDELKGGDLGEMGEVAYELVPSSESPMAKMAEKEKEKLPEVV
ncbi:hypothetical protein HK102_004062 [Quaeritorhiza haematococci]|nr:hypothetical protein HK102_004062 [Quaeritorhiza haematococci]